MTLLILIWYLTLTMIWYMILIWLRDTILTWHLNNFYKLKKIKNHELTYDTHGSSLINYLNVVIEKLNWQKLRSCWTWKKNWLH